MIASLLPKREDRSHFRVGKETSVKEPGGSVREGSPIRSPRTARTPPPSRQARSSLRVNGAGRKDRCLASPPLHLHRSAALPPAGVRACKLLLCCLILLSCDAARGWPGTSHWCSVLVFKSGAFRGVSDVGCTVGVHAGIVSPTHHRGRHRRSRPHDRHHRSGRRRRSHRHRSSRRRSCHGRHHRSRGRPQR